MYEFIDSAITELLGEGFWAVFLSGAIKLACALVTAAIIYIALRTVNGIIFAKSKNKNLNLAGKFIFERKPISKLSALIFFVLIYSIFPKISAIGAIISLILLTSSVLDIVNDLYMTKSISKRRPIKGPLQIVKITIDVLLSIILTAVLINQEPLVLISGVGAFTAILSIIFKDALTGLVAGVQITSENMLEIGDWISIPSMDVEGEVTDIALITVKIKAFDNTIITVPSSTFQSTPFKNWHKTIKGKQRQVNFSLSIDPDTVKADGDSTNLTKWRNHITETIKNDPHCKTKLSVIVKTEGSKSGYGIPVSILFTTDIVNYEEFCEYNSLKGELAIASLKDFNLKPFQARPSSASKKASS